MGDLSKIGWTDRTQNFWVGCQHVSSGCDNCYMFTEQKRYGNNPEVVRRTSDANFYKPTKSKVWKTPARVFTNSWSDFFIKEADGAWRDDAWRVIRDTPWLSWQILTKRPARIKSHLPADWGSEGYPNVWLGVSTENQDWAERRIPLLLDIPAPVHFISAEPLLGPLSLKADWFKRGLNWVITGAESGPKHRAMDESWVSVIQKDCCNNECAFFYKQRVEDNGHKVEGPFLAGRQYLEYPA